MTVNILMPALSPTMTEGTLATWQVKEGDAIKSGDVIAEIETDKATMEVEAVEEGTIGKILVAEGTEGVAVNAVIAILLEEGESAGDIDVAAAKADAPSAPKSEDTDDTAEKKEESAPKQEEKAPAPKQEKQTQEQVQEPAGDGERIFASPLARRMATQAGLDLAKLQGSGPHGRIVKADIEAARDGKATEAAPTAAPQATAPSAPAQAAAAALRPRPWPMPWAWNTSSSRCRRCAKPSPRGFRNPSRPCRTSTSPSTARWTSC